MWRSMIFSILLAAAVVMGEPPAKPKVAVFPLSGSATEQLREQVGFSLRSKLDRDGIYQVIDGFAMKEAVADLAEPINRASSLAQVRAIGDELEAEILIWGDLSKDSGGAVLNLNVFDRLQLDPNPHTLSKLIARPTDLRFVTEQILQTLPGVRRFEHPSEQAVQDDPTARDSWQANPNLITNGTFDADGSWNFIYLDINQPIKLQNRLPAPDEAIITEIDGNRVLAMRLSQTSAENNGLAVLSQSIPIEPNTRYRLSFRYQSAGPKLHVFVKGYTRFANINGEQVEREIYRRQVPPTGDTEGAWVTIVDELNPQHVAFPVQTLKIDLYAYLYPGLLMFDDITLKAVGGQTRNAADDAIDKPIDRPGN